MDNQNKQPITVEEIIKVTIDELRAVYVPAELVEPIGIHVSRALNNLKVVNEVFENAKKEKEQKESEIQIGEPEIELVPTSEVPEDAEVVEL